MEKPWPGPSGAFAGLGRQGEASATSSFS